MLSFVLALMLQQAVPLTVAPGAVTWETPPSTTQVATEGPPLARTLPDWAIADPHAWERSQCSPLLRPRDVTQEQCQARVRAELTLNLGAGLPADLSPSSIPTQCGPAPTGDGAYTVTCAPPERKASGVSSPTDQICEQRPQRLPGGGVSFASECRPATPTRKADTPRITLFGRSVD